MAVRQVAAVREVHAQHRVAGLQRGQIDGHICLRAGVRLHVRVLGAEKLLSRGQWQAARRCPRIRSRRNSASRRIAFGIFVGHHRAHRFEHRLGNEILRGDQLDAGGLAANFVANHCRNFRIHFVERPAHSSKFRSLFGHKYVILAKAVDEWRATPNLSASVLKETPAVMHGGIH